MAEHFSLGMTVGKYRRLWLKTVLREKTDDVWQTKADKLKRRNWENKTLCLIDFPSSFSVSLCFL